MSDDVRGGHPARDDADVLRALELDESYEVVRTLADGPTGTTQLVRRDGRAFVRKRIPADLANRDAWEAARAARCPQLPAIREVYELPDALCVVCDRVGGETVADLLRRRGRLSVEEAARVALDVCAAAGALHARGVVHRDITPTNVLVAFDGTRLIDLGIARTHDERESRDTTTLGTWGFAAPEQFGFAQTDARSDVFAIGRLLACMVVGLMPDDEGFDAALDDRASVPARLAAVVRRACAFEPSTRYASARELARAITRATGVEQGARPSDVSCAATWRRRRRVALVAPLGGLALTGGALALALVSIARDQTGRDGVASLALAVSWGLLAADALWAQPLRALLGRGRYAGQPTDGDVDPQADASAGAGARRPATRAVRAVRRHPYLTVLVRDLLLAIVALAAIVVASALADRAGA